MAINERAKQHYDNAVRLFIAANNPEVAPETTQALANLSWLSLALADFAVVNHALVAGIDTDQAQTMKPDGNSAVWGGPPLPAHIAEWEARQR